MYARGGRRQALGPAVAVDPHEVDQAGLAGGVDERAVGRQANQRQASRQPDHAGRDHGDGIPGDFRGACVKRHRHDRVVAEEQQVPRGGIHRRRGTTHHDPADAVGGVDGFDAGRIAFVVAQRSVARDPAGEQHDAGRQDVAGRVRHLSARGVEARQPRRRRSGRGHAPQSVAPEHDGAVDAPERSVGARRGRDVGDQAVTQRQPFQRAVA